METAILHGWSDFFVAAAGAASALAGLVFVALSINLARIIELPGVSGRAAETIIVLAGALTLALVALIPGHSEASLSLAVLGVAGLSWLLPLSIQVRHIRLRAYHRRGLVALRLVLHQLATLPAIIAGLVMLGSNPGGMMWLALGIILSMLVAIFSAWVLLVEILR